MSNRLKLYTFLLSFLLVYSCANRQQNTPMEMDGTSWKLIQMPGGLPDKGEVTLKFEEGRISGKGICNSYFSNYEMSGKKISFGPVGATKMMCPEHADVEAKFFEALHNAQELDINQQQLTIITKMGKLVFEMANPATS